MRQGKPGRAMAGPSMTQYAVAFVCTAAVTALAYSNSLHGKFVFDDLPAIVQNPDVNSSRTSWTFAFRDNFWGEPMDAPYAQHASYRPLTTLSFRWGHDIHGMQEFGFHVTNVLIHLVVSCLVVVMTPHILDAPSTTELVLAGSLFAAHPIHTEAVTGLVGRAELLAGVFFILSFLAYTRTRSFNSPTALGGPGVGWTIAAVALATAAMLSKEQGVTVVGVCLAYELLVNCRLNPIALFQRRRGSRRQDKVKPKRISTTRATTTTNKPSSSSPKGKGKTTTATAGQREPFVRMTPTAVVRIVVLLFLAAVIMKYRVALNTVDIKVDEKTNPANHIDDTALRWLTKNLYVTLHAWLLLFPVWLCCDWSGGAVPVFTSVVDPRIAYIALFYAAVAGIVVAAMRAARPVRNAVLLSLAITAASFIPASGLFMEVGFVLAERVLYLPSIGFCLLLLCGGRALMRTAPLQWRSVAAVALSALVAAYAMRTFTRNEDWRDELSLYKSGLIAAPTNAKLHHNAAYYMEGEEQERHYREAIRLYPPYVSAYINLGVNLATAGRLDEAIETYKKGLEMHYKHPIYSTDVGVILRNLGFAYRRKGDLRAALDTFKRCLKVRTDHTKCRYMVKELEAQLKSQKHKEQQQQQQQQRGGGTGSGHRNEEEEEFRAKVRHVGGEDDLQRLRREKSGTMVMFYAPWCEHCRAMHADYMKAKARLNTPVVAVDCTQQKQLCQQEDVKGYPTIRLLGETRKEDVDYTGTRRAADDLVAFVNSNRTGTRRTGGQGRA